MNANKTLRLIGRLQIIFKHLIFVFHQNAHESSRRFSVPSGVLPRSGMRLIVLFSHTRLCDMGVDFGGGEVGVSQQLLNRSQIGAVFKQMSGEGMTQNMWGDLKPLSHNAGIPVKNSSYSAIRDSLAEFI